MNGDLSSHQIAIALFQPQIAPNTGNIARLCVATGTELHLVRPMGFVLSDRELRRSAMDYWARLKLTVHDSTEGFLHDFRNRRLWFFDSMGQNNFWNIAFKPADVLVFGSETRGIDPALLASRQEQTLRLPQVAGERCLNIASAVSAALYESIRQVAVPH
jgi:tRNA (cytidine/uridine-2'-O-)-methyltransferase